MPSNNPTDELNRNIEKDCISLLNYLNQFIDKPLSTLPNMKMISDNKSELFGGRYCNDSYDNLRSKVEDRLRLINSRPDLFGSVGLYGTTDFKTKFIMRANGTWDNEARGKSIHYGITRKFVSSEIPEAIGTDALSILSLFHKLGEEVYLPTLADMPEIIEALKRRFGVEDVNGQLLNPFYMPDDITGRRQCELLNFPVDGCSLIRERIFLDGDDDEMSFDKIFRLAVKCYIGKEILSIKYCPPGRDEQNYLLDPVIVSIVMKHGGVYLVGAVWDQKKLRYLPKSSDNSSLRIQTLKIDRIVDIKPAGIGSTLTQEQFDLIGRNIRSNDGIYYVPPEERFDAIIKVSPTYSYYEEAVPFRSQSAKKKLSPEKLAIIGQPMESACYLVTATNMEHLKNEVIKSRGNIVVLSPEKAVAEIRDEMKRILECQLLAEPKGIAPVTFPDYKMPPNGPALASNGELPKSVPPELK